MNVGIFTNKYRDTKNSVTNKLIQLFDKSGINTLLYGYKNNSLVLPQDLSKKPDVMLTLGGDGTVLRIVGYCATNDIPILGINLGNVGFLTGLENSELDSIVDVLKNKKYTTDTRAMLEVEFNGDKFLALNDIVFSRATVNKMISIDIFVNDSFMDNYYCDGFVVATPTGSTAYSLSAGGSIISPTTDALALTPICPHTLHARPVVVSGNDKIVATVSKKTDECIVIADGERIGNITKNNTATILKSKKVAKFIKTDNNSFFYRLLNKLNMWGVTPNKEEEN